MRRDDWADRLWQTAGEWKPHSFAWGEHDCCKFAAACVDAMTGSEFGRALTYTNLRGAAEWVEEAGGLIPAVSAYLGDVSVGYPRRGDVCVLPSDDPMGAGLGVCFGPTIYAYTSRGLIEIPVTSCVHWRV